VTRRQTNRWARQDEQQYYEQQQQQQQYQQQAQPAPPAAAPDRMDQLKELGELKAQGVLTEEEFAREKARILGS
jgi:hypothetical protein